MKILVVDDEIHIRELCQRLLRGEGYEVETAADGVEALERLRDGWDIILTDITMPGGVDGLRVVREARALGEADVIVMTAYPEINIVIAALREGAYDFLIKPYNSETLFRAVSRCAEKRRLSVQLSREQSLRKELETAYGELVELKKINDTFGHFVSPEVVRYLTEHPELFHQRAGERVTASVMFVDVRRFTPFAVSAAPERALATLNQIFQRVVEAVNGEGGVLNKFMGDGALALFGAPVPLKDHAAAAARAALKLRDAVDRLAAERKAEGLEALRVGVGINTGLVVAGYLGSAERAEYTVIGNTVNTAARLEGIAAPGQILVGPETRKALEKDFGLKMLAPRKLAGLPEPLAVYELTGEGRAADPETAALPPDARLSASNE
jgi:class 3 adenylate cyclase/FixJ family two-component response regulator